MRALAPEVLLSCPVQSFSAASLVVPSQTKNGKGFRAGVRTRRHGSFSNRQGPEGRPLDVSPAGQGWDIDGVIPACPACPGMPWSVPWEHRRCGTPSHPSQFRIAGHAEGQGDSMPSAPTLGIGVVSPLSPGVMVNTNRQ